MYTFKELLSLRNNFSITNVIFSVRIALHMISCIIMELIQIYLKCFKYIFASGIRYHDFKFYREHKIYFKSSPHFKEQH